MRGWFFLAIFLYYCCNFFCSLRETVDVRVPPRGEAVFRVGHGGGCTDHPSSQAPFPPRCSQTEGGWGAQLKLSRNKQTLRPAVSPQGPRAPVEPVLDSADTEVSRNAEGGELLLASGPVEAGPWDQQGLPVLAALVLRAVHKSRWAVQRSPLPSDHRAVQERDPAVGSLPACPALTAGILAVMGPGSPQLAQ